MKNNFILFLSLSLLFSACRNERKVDDNILVIEYIEKYHPNEIQENEFVFATYRTKVVCSNCRGDISMSELVDTIKNRYHDIPVFILTDDTIYNERDSLSALKRINSNLKCLFIEQSKIMQRYNLYGNFPGLYRISDMKVIEALRLIKTK